VCVSLASDNVWHIIGIQSVWKKEKEGVKKGRNMNMTLGCIPYAVNLIQILNYHGIKGTIQFLINLLPGNTC
jgi:hypothetical protein